MQRFETPESIAVAVEIGMGAIRIAAGDRAETTVEVLPADPARPADVAAAEETRIELAEGALQVRGTRRWRAIGPFGGDGAVDVRIELPAGSRVTGHVGMGTFRLTGPFGDLRLRSGAGDIHVEEAAAASLVVGAGDIVVERATGDVQVTTGSGAARVGRIGGAASIKSANGDIRVEETAGELKVRTANGAIAVERSRGALTAKTANGAIRLGGVEGGPVVAESAFGPIEIGVPRGVAAWLDLDAKRGRLRNELDALPPEPDQPTVEVRAGSGFGDITVRRAVTEAATAA
jgi:hypothetical protein